MNKLRAIVFYQYLPPWRIDVFNKMGEYYDLTIVFINADCEGFTYNRSELLKQLKGIKTIFLTNGVKIKGRPFRLGIFKIIKQINPAIIFSHEYSPTSVVVALYKQMGLFHFKYYITTSDNCQMAENVGGIKAIMRKYVLNNSNGIIVYSNSVKDWYKTNFPKLKIEICPNIQNPKTLLSYKPNFPNIEKSYNQTFNLTNKNIILYTGRLVDVKGLDLLLNAFAKSQIDDYVLVLVGEGNLKNDLFELSKKLGICEKVIFAGYFSGIKLYAWYDIANFFILPSRYEPFGAVVNEALVYGCPVMASKYIGAVDFITKENGFLFDPLNEDEFIKGLREACIKYKEHKTSKHNLMPCSFDEYVSAFYKINQK